MRNIFDQYSQPENRLTHALAVCLSEDRRLLAAWLKWIGQDPSTRAAKLTIVEQRLPGEFELRESAADGRGLPDIVIHDEAGWCVFIESKLESSLTGAGASAQAVFRRLCERGTSSRNRSRMLPIGISSSHATEQRANCGL
jgi:hypothetical protein